ncbi:MAG: lectin ESA-2 [Proteobacteria bacterium]|nr:lectin ESA-2 [Pseudomonadota bacterium]
MSNTNSYKVQVQWGGSAAPWHQDGIWVVGGRDNQSAVALNIISHNGGQTFTGTMQYEGEGPLGFRAQQESGNSYNTWVQWGGSSAPWHENGIWVIGGRDGQRGVEVNISSGDGGQTFLGNIIYAGEGPIGFKAEQDFKAGFNSYDTEVQWGGSAEPWHANGVWIIGGRDKQHAVAVDINSGDGGKSFTGSMTYAGEGPLGFQATLKGDNEYDTWVQWGGSYAPWHQNGVWVIGGRDKQNAVALKIDSKDGGETFTGTMTYDGEGPIGFKAKNTD